MSEAKLNVELPADAIKDLAIKAILDALTPEKREQLITASLQNMVTVRDQYSRLQGRNGCSALERMMEDVIWQTAETIVRESLQTDVFKEKVRCLTMAALDKAFNETDESGAVTKIADAITHALFRKGY